MLEICANIQKNKNFQRRQKYFFFKTCTSNIHLPSFKVDYQSDNSNSSDEEITKIIASKRKNKRKRVEIKHPESDPNQKHAISSKVSKFLKSLREKEKEIDNSFLESETKPESSINDDSSPSQKSKKSIPDQKLFGDWRQIVHTDGSVYYWNEVTDQTTWEKPSRKFVDKSTQTQQKAVDMELE